MCIFTIIQVTGQYKVFHGLTWQDCSCICKSAVSPSPVFLPICHVDLKVLLFPCGSSFCRVYREGGVAWWVYTEYGVRSTMLYFVWSTDTSYGIHSSEVFLSNFWPYSYVHRRSDISRSNVRTDYEIVLYKTLFSLIDSDLIGFIHVQSLVRACN